MIYFVNTFCYIILKFICRCDCLERKKGLREKKKKIGKQGTGKEERTKMGDKKKQRTHGSPVEGMVRGRVAIECRFEGRWPS